MRKMTPILRLTPPPEDDPLEAAHQTRIFQLLIPTHLDQYPELADLFAVPNGGWRHKATAVAMQAQGVKPGVPDMCLPHARGGWHGLWIELKREHEGQPTPAQRDRLLRLQKAGYRAVVCFGWRMAWAELLRYLRLPQTEPCDPPPAYNPLPKRSTSTQPRESKENPV